MAIERMRKPGPPPPRTGSMQGHPCPILTPGGGLSGVYERAGRGSACPFPLPLTMAQGEHLFRKLWPLFPPSFLPSGPSCLHPSHCSVQPRSGQVLPLGNSLSAGRGPNWVFPSPKKRRRNGVSEAAGPGSLCPLPAFQIGGESSRRVSKVRVRRSLSPRLAQSWEGSYPAVSVPLLIHTSPFPIVLLADAGVPGRRL